MIFKTRNVAIRGVNHHLHISGSTDGPVALFLHGLMDTGASFGPLVEAMQDMVQTPLRCIAPDWRGHGDSGRAKNGYWFPDYLADLDCLIAEFSQNKPVILVGHSMGGQVASMYAGVRPDAVSHLITLDSLNMPDAAIDNTPARYRNWLDALHSPIIEKHYATLDELAKRIAYHYPELSVATRLFLADNWTRPTAENKLKLAFDPRHRWPFPYGFRLEEAKALWRAAKAKTLCIDAEHGFARRWVSETEMANRHACFASIECSTAPGCGHMLHVQAPDIVADMVSTFVNKR